MIETIVATSLAKGSAQEAAASLEAAVHLQLGAHAPKLVLVFASTAQPLDTVVAALAPSFAGAIVLGASTAGEFTEKGDAKGSTSIFAIAGDYQVFGGMGTGLKANPEQAITQALEGLPRAVSGYPHCTALLLLDPMAGNGDEATLLAASLLGDGVRLAGGAAGDDLAMKATHVSLGGKAASDAAVIALIFSRTPLGVGVSHGHVPLSAPLKVTRAAGNVVSEIGGRPAWDVWREKTRDEAKAAGYDTSALKASEETAYLLRFEAGLATGDTFKIRAPLSRNEDGSINFACGVPEGSVFQITESVPERQVASAREAAKRAKEQLGGKAAAGAIVFDCICRKLILNEDFARAVRGMSEELGGAPLAGFETYGEIALDVGEMSGFHNTTSVVLAFPKS